MDRKVWAYMAVAAVALSLVWAAAIQAGTTPPDKIEIYAPYEHTRSAVEFDHAKHVNEYKLACGECHHDDKGKPLTNLKAGDEVKRCFDCHNKPGEVKGKKAKEMSEKEQLAYHANALHENCIGCHKAYNKKNKTKAAPQKCLECHPKK